MKSGVFAGGCAKTPQKGGGKMLQIVSFIVESSFLRD